MNTMAFLCALLLSGVEASDRLESHVGRPADIAPSAYLYRADRTAEENPPESWILLIQHAGLAYDRPVDMKAPAVRRALCGLLWEEVRPVRRVELSWEPGVVNRPSSEELTLSYFDATDATAHTWWNPRSLKEAGEPEVSADGRTYCFSIPTDTWGLVVSIRGEKDASAFAVPTLRTLVADPWKMVDVEIEWGFAEGKEGLDSSGRIEAYDGIVGGLRPLPGDAGTTLTGALSWRSAAKGSARRGVQMSVLYMGSSRWRRVWPYHARPEDVARTILTVWTSSGSFSFQVSDLEMGPILAPEQGFFVRAISRRTEGRAPAGEAPAPAMDRSVPRQTLDMKMDEIPGVPRVRGWSASGMPWFGANSSGEAGKSGSLTVPPRSVLLHPGPDRDVAAGWRSPVQGRVSVRGKVAAGDAQGGNGVEWWILRESPAGRRVLSSGAIDTGGSRAFPAGAEAGQLAEVPVEPGDWLSLIVGSKDGNHSCDTTAIELAIAELGGEKRVWDLTRDVVDSIHAGNPHGDSLGNPGVWHFYAVQDPTRAGPTSASQPPIRLESQAASAREFVQELAGRRLQTVRQRVREHPEQSWEGAVGAMKGTDLPPIPAPPFEPAMQVDVPCERLTAQWKLGAWHILRRSVQDEKGVWRFNDYPFGILASETYMILRALDLQGLHVEAAGGLDQWLRLPLEHDAQSKGPGHHPWSFPDRPLGLFSDGRGCLTHAAGPPGAGGHMDGVHCMGPGAIMHTLAEHFFLTGDMERLRAAVPRMKANAEWILRQRRLLAGILPGGERLWSKGLQPAHVVTPDSECMHMQFYETEAYYWLAVQRMAELLERIEPAEGARMAAEAEAYRRDLLAAVDRSIALTPVVPVRDGTYRSFIPFAPYVRGFAAGAWGWKRCQGHVGAIYWDTVQSADPLISPAGLLSPSDPRVQGHLDVLEDRLLLENTKVSGQAGFDPEKDWFSRASWQYQCGLERHASIHLEADDVPNFIRSMLNQYAVDIMPGEYTFREHTTGGPPDKIFEEACFLERFRNLLVMEEGDALWLARAAPRAWLQQGERIAVKNAPTHFGAVDYEILSHVDGGKIAATVKMPSRGAPGGVLLRLRHPKAAPIRSVAVDGRSWKDWDAAREVIRLHGLEGTVSVEAAY